MRVITYTQQNKHAFSTQNKRWQHADGTESGTGADEVLENNEYILRMESAEYTEIFQGRKL